MLPLATSGICKHANRITKYKTQKKKKVNDFLKLNSRSVRPVNKDKTHGNHLTEKTKKQDKSKGNTSSSTPPQKSRETIKFNFMLTYK